MKSSNQKNENILTRKTEIEEWKKKIYIRPQEQARSQK